MHHNLGRRAGVRSPRHAHNVSHEYPALDRALPGAALGQAPDPSPPHCLQGASKRFALSRTLQLLAYTLWPALLIWVLMSNWGRASHTTGASVVHPTGRGLGLAQ